MILVRADRGGFDHAAKRAGEPVALDIQRRAGRQVGSQTLRLGRRQPHDGAILQQRTVQVALRPMKLSLDVSLRGQHLLGASRTRRTAGSIVDNGVAGRVIRDRQGLHHRDGPGAEAVNGHRIAGLHRKDQLRAEVWRHMHLGPVRQDQSVHIAARRQAVLPDLPLDCRQLAGVIGRRLLRSGYAGTARNQRRGQQSMSCPHRCPPSSGLWPDGATASGVPAISY